MGSILKIRLAGAVLATLLVATPALAAQTHVVEMLDKGASGTFAYDPELLLVDPGDTVSFKATTRGHDVSFVVVPEGARMQNVPLGREAALSFEVPGVYLYRCTPHIGQGMIGLVVVGGDLSNADAVLAARLPPRARERVAALLDEARARLDEAGIDERAATGDIETQAADGSTIEAHEAPARAD